MEKETKMKNREEELFEIARLWALEAPLGETVYRFRRVWGEAVLKLLEENEEILKLFEKSSCWRCKKYVDADKFMKKL